MTRYSENIYTSDSDKKKLIYDGKPGIPYSPYDPMINRVNGLGLNMKKYGIMEVNIEL
jgi:hypothetical protein